MAASQSPSVSIRSRSGPAADSPAETSSPPAETSSPAAETSSPPAETSSPAAETSSPAAETSSPPAETSSLPADNGSISVNLNRVRRRNASQAANTLVTSSESQGSQMNNNLRSRIQRRQAAGRAGVQSLRRRRNGEIRSRVRDPRRQRSREIRSRVRGRGTVGRSRRSETAVPVPLQPVEQQPGIRATGTPRPVGRPRGRPATQAIVLSGRNSARQGRHSDGRQTARRPARRDERRRDERRRDEGRRDESISGYNDDVLHVVPRRHQRGVGRRRNPNPRPRRSRVNDVLRQARIQTVQAQRRHIQRPVLGGHPLTQTSRVNQRALYRLLSDISLLLRNPTFRELFPSQHQTQQVPFQIPAAEVLSQQFYPEF